VYCWGLNYYGELGNNSTTQSNVPVQVEGVGGSGLLSGIASIAAGGYHTCALSATGRIDC
jgi:alpha-tubulin suppressor-like RCC1 family protein